MSINCDRHDLPSDRCGYCKDEEIDQLRAENERLKDVIAKCAEALDEALFTKHNETSFVFCTLKLERALAAIKEMRNEQTL